MGEHKTKCWMGPKLRGTREERDELERTIVAALRSAGGNLHAAATLLAVHVATLARYVDRLGLGPLLERARNAPGAQIAKKTRAKRAGRLGGRPRKAPPAGP